MANQKKINSFFIVIALLMFQISKGQDTTSVIYQDTTIATPIPQTWQYVTSTVSNNRWYIYKKYLSKENEKIEIWVKIEWDTTTFKKKLYKNAYELYLYVIDCKNQKVKTLKGILYNSSGALIDNYTFPSPTFEYIIPDTALESVVERICNLYN